MAAPRRVEPEWLDLLPADDPRARASRRDLSRVNTWMLQAGIMARSLIEHGGPTAPRALVDLGAGDGTFMLSVARRLAPRWPNVRVILLDRQSIVSPSTQAEFAALRWRCESIAMDVFDFFEQANPPAADVATANLFLHHFEQDQLARLLALVARSARLFVACEPRRGAFALLGSRRLWAIGANDVTRHDALASVRAGFDAAELSALWPEPAQWELHERAAGPFSHQFVARRRSASA
jgi:hypothetical protein